MSAVELGVPETGVAIVLGAGAVSALIGALVYWLKKRHEQ